MNAVQALATAFAPWQSLYSNSKLVSTSVTATHILALVVGGGIAIASDRSTLRALRGSPGERQYQLRELHSAHTVVISALTVLFVSGALLAAADVETFATSPLFWLKLGLVALLCTNGVWLYRTEHRIASLVEPTPALWRKLKWSAWISLMLWLLVAIAGTVLTNA